MFPWRIHAEAFKQLILPYNNSQQLNYYPKAILCQPPSKHENWPTTTPSAPPSLSNSTCDVSASIYKEVWHFLSLSLPYPPCPSLTRLALVPQIISKGPGDQSWPSFLNGKEWGMYFVNHLFEEKKKKTPTPLPQLLSYHFFLFSLLSPSSWDSACHLSRQFFYYAEKISWPSSSGDGWEERPGECRSATQEH